MLLNWAMGRKCGFVEVVRCAEVFVCCNAGVVRCVDREVESFLFATHWAIWLGLGNAGGRRKGYVRHIYCNSWLARKQQRDRAKRENGVKECEVEASPFIPAQRRSEATVSDETKR